MKARDPAAVLTPDPAAGVHCAGDAADLTKQAPDLRSHA
jgi:hypothetical protein